MNRIFLKNSVLLLAAAAVAAAGCSDDEAFGGDTHCRGRLDIGGAPSATVVTRAETAGTNLADVFPGLKVPAADELRLTLTGSDIAELESGENGTVEVGRFDYEKHWETLASYNKKLPELFPGEYRAVLQYGDPDAVGPNAPYYRGENRATVEIGKETPCRIDVKICNSAVRVVADERFTNYFYAPDFTLWLGEGEEKQEIGRFTLTAADEPIFVPAGSVVSVTGSVRRPSQTSDGAGEELKIENVPDRTTVAGTLHTFRFTAQAGSAGFSVSFVDPEVEPDDSHDVELNDDAQSDKTDGGESGEPTTPAE